MTKFLLFFALSLSLSSYAEIWTANKVHSEILLSVPYMGFLVGDVITFWGVFQMQPIRAKTPNSKHMIPDNKILRERDIKRQEEESGFSKKLRNLINGK